MNTSPNKLIVYDGVCRLCSAFVNFVLLADKNREFYFCSAQSDLGQVVLRHFDYPAGVVPEGEGGDIQDYKSVLLVRNWGTDAANVAEKSDAFIQVMSECAYPYKVLSVSRFIPKLLRDWLYDRIAANRYRLFGKYDYCRLPNRAHATRFID